MPMLNIPPTKYNPTNNLYDPDKSTSIEESSGEEQFSTEANEANDDNNLNRRLNIDDNDDLSLKLFGCNNTVLSRTGKLPKFESQPQLRSHRQHSQLGRNNTGQHEINSIPLRRLQYQSHRKRYNN